MILLCTTRKKRKLEKIFLLYIISLIEGVEEPGVMWESESWRLSDNGIVFYESPLDGKSKVTKGVQYFGITGKDKVFSLLPEDKNIPVTLNQASREFWRH